MWSPSRGLAAVFRNPPFGKPYISFHVSESFCLNVLKRGKINDEIRILGRY